MRPCFFLKSALHYLHPIIRSDTIYQEFNLGNPYNSSFQERIKKSIIAIGAIENLKNELQEIGWDETDINPLSHNLEGSLNQAAFIMQKLRSGMSDVHGTKPVISAVVYDSTKWSLLILRILITRKDL